jgi:ketol-acid reductoisomerase
MVEYRAGMPELKARCEKDSEHALEVVGRRLRSQMSWSDGSRLVDRKQN